ncbi:hypothetical protein JVT61DRAFT_10123 [Boletus reticuloceps]|uniref:Uncharacterized protein n=1 Tax=Boletus reticuloceps TaxID=495285 RepID=A0A8I2YUH5_9AGAM|nr:hypothetical protein JVT61DRAFT_10123 [Boletus reticuloceps]
MQPDVVFALTDTPFTPPPYSQKRVTKSIERSTAWVADILQPMPGDAGASEPHTPRLSRHPLNVLVHMAGGTSLPAREAFAHGLRDRLHGPEADAVKPLRCLDDGITGYVFDLAVLRGIKPSPNTSQHQSLPDDLLQLERPEMLQHPESIAEASTPRNAGGSRSDGVGRLVHQRAIRPAGYHVHAQGVARGALGAETASRDGNTIAP